MMKASLTVITLISTLLILPTTRVMSQSNPVFLQLGRAKGALYKPDAGPEPRIGIVVMHREANFMNNVACGEFAKRGFLVLCMNSRFENSESAVKWEQIPLDVGEGVKQLKKQLGAGGKIILLWSQRRRRDHEFLSSGRGKWTGGLSGRQQVRAMRKRS